MAVCLVVGGSSFVGWHLVEALAHAGNAVRVLDHDPAGGSFVPEFRGPVECVTGDLTYYPLVRRAARGVDFVFHQALPLPSSRAVSDLVTAQQVYLTGILHTLTAARESGCRRVILATTRRVYGPAGRRPMRENDAASPASLESVMELTGEQHCLAFTRRYGLETVRLRYFEVFGPRHSPWAPCSTLVFRVLKAMLAGQRPVILGNGHEPHDVIHVEDVVHANLLAARAPRVSGKVYNVARGRPTTPREVVATINAILGTRIRPLFRAGVCPEELAGQVASVAHTETELGFCPSVDLERGLRRCIEHYAASLGTRALLTSS